MPNELTDFVFVTDQRKAPGTVCPATKTDLRPLLNLGLVLAAFIAMATMGTAFAQTYEGHHSNPWLLSWIPASCCVTNDCCWEVSERELHPMANDSWQVMATSQVVKRTGWTPDGKFYRCACDLAEGKWVKHQGANTRCVFVPLRSAGL
jgi:hypothetical protein